MQLVVVMAVRNAVSAATTTFTAISIKRFVLIRLILFFDNGFHGFHGFSKVKKNSQILKFLKIELIRLIRVIRCRN